MSAEAEVLTNGGTDRVEMVFMEKVRAYIPDDLPDSEAVIEQVSEELTELYGGATIYPETTGLWKNEAGEVEYDSITIVESMSERIDPDDVAELARYVKDVLEEDAVLFEIIQTSSMLI